MKKLLIPLFIICALTLNLRAMNTPDNLQEENNNLDVWLARLSKLPPDEKKSVTLRLNKFATVPEIKKNVPLLIAEAEKNVVLQNKK
jgi:hypothetical protein